MRRILHGKKEKSHDVDNCVARKLPTAVPVPQHKGEWCTEVGSKDGVPRVTGTRGQCFQRELVPFRNFNRSSPNLNVHRWKGVECVESKSTPKSFLFFEHLAVQPNTRLNRKSILRFQTEVHPIDNACCQLPAGTNDDCQILETRLYASAAPSSNADFQVP